MYLINSDLIYRLSSWDLFHESSSEMRLFGVEGSVFTSIWICSLHSTTRTIFFSSSKQLLEKILIASLRIETITGGLTLEFDHRNAHCAASTGDYPHDLQLYITLVSLLIKYLVKRQPTFSVDSTLQSAPSFLSQNYGTRINVNSWGVLIRYYMTC